MVSAAAIGVVCAGSRLLAEYTNKETLLAPKARCADSDNGSSFFLFPFHVVGVRSYRCPCKYYLEQITRILCLKNNEPITICAFFMMIAAVDY